MSSWRQCFSDKLIKPKFKDKIVRMGVLVVIETYFSLKNKSPRVEHFINKNCSPFSCKIIIKYIINNIVIIVNVIPNTGSIK